MSSVIVYGSTKKPTRRSASRWCYRTEKVGKKTLYLRIEASGHDCLTALDKAKPLKNETILNSMDI